MTRALLPAGHPPDPRQGMGGVCREGRGVGQAKGRLSGSGGPAACARASALGYSHRRAYSPQSAREHLPPCRHRRDLCYSGSERRHACPELTHVRESLGCAHRIWVALGRLCAPWPAPCDGPPLCPHACHPHACPACPACSLVSRARRAAAAGRRRAAPAGRRGLDAAGADGNGHEHRLWQVVQRTPAGRRRPSSRARASSRQQGRAEAIEVRDESTINEALPSRKNARMPVPDG
jgi:hypothetical protein